METIKTLDNVKTILFSDETKFSINAGDVEDSIFYFAVAVKKNDVGRINHLLQTILDSHRVQAQTFHATSIFKQSRPRANLMRDICNMIIENQLHCFVFKYSKRILFEPTKHLNYLNDGDLFQFENAEFQALFYYIMILNTHLRDKMANQLERDMVMYFDRNVYGKEQTEVFNFPHDEFVIRHMTFSNKSLISLLALPDFFGYIFRKSKISQNKVEVGNLALETSQLAINSYLALMRITGAKLFHFLDMDDYIEAIDIVLGVKAKE